MSLGTYPDSNRNARKTPRNVPSREERLAPLVSRADFNRTSAA